MFIIFRATSVKLNTPHSFGELPDVKRIFTPVEISMNSGASVVTENSNLKRLGNDYDDCDDLSNKSSDS